MVSHPPDTDDRRFTDRETKLIFERASEADVSAQGDRGHTLAELQEIARQVRLDPAECRYRRIDNQRTPTSDLVERWAGKTNALMESVTEAASRSRHLP